MLFTLRGYWFRHLVQARGGGVTFSVFGTTTAMGTQLSLAGVMAVGAMAGFASGAIMTGSLEGALQGALWGAVSAGVAFGVGETLGHAGGIFTKGIKSGQAFIKAAAHGLSRGIISMAQGGTFKSGFASGFSASFFSPGTTMGGDGAGGFGLRTSIAAIAGGTASALGGGKFSNGAISGAFVHMFNAEAKAYLIKNRQTLAWNQAKEAALAKNHTILDTMLSPVSLALSVASGFLTGGDAWLVWGTGGGIGAYTTYKNPENYSDGLGPTVVSPPTAGAVGAATGTAWTLYSITKSNDVDK